MNTFRICPNEDKFRNLSKHIKVYYKDTEIPCVYAIELTEETLKRLLDNATKKLLAFKEDL